MLQSISERLHALPGKRSSCGLSLWPQRHGDIWQDLVDTYGFAAGYQSVRRFVSKLHSEPVSAEAACAVIETAPGEEAQVDYGDGPMVRDPNIGKYRRTRLVLLVLRSPRL